MGGAEPPPPPAGILGPAEEQALLDDLILGCWEQGCWLGEGIADLALDGPAQHALFAAAEGLAPLHREAALAATGHAIPELLAADPADPDPAAWLVLTQRCDLIKGLGQEPTVALVRMGRLPLAEARDRTRRSASFYLARATPEWGWVADFRQAIAIPKAALRGRPPQQCLADGAEARRRFALAAAQRAWRRPVPAEIAQAIGIPLERRRKPWQAPFLRHVSDILVGRVPGGLVVYALLAPEADERGARSDEAELARFFDTTVLPYLEEQSPGEVDADASRLVPAAEATMRMIFDTYRLDLGYLSAGEGDAPPRL